MWQIQTLSWELVPRSDTTQCCGDNTQTSRTIPKPEGKLCTQKMQQKQTGPSQLIFRTPCQKKGPLRVSAVQIISWLLCKHLWEWRYRPDYMNINHSKKIINLQHTPHPSDCACWSRKVEWKDMNYPYSSTNPDNHQKFCAEPKISKDKGVLSL